jgi:pSer/pThr/pTyr-binding forkhead associated (FHA) protein
MRLVVVEGKAKGTQLRLDARDGFSVGRSPQADLPLDDPQVADLHLRAYKDGPSWLSVDLSKSGFVHNGTHTQRATLAAGDTLQVGAHVLQLITDSTQAAPKVDSRSVPRPQSTGPFLVARKGNDAGKVYSLVTPKTALIIGRGVATDITIWDIRASRAHARIDVQEGRYVVRDLSSSNGTYLNEEKLSASKPHELATGDQIRIGSTVLEFNA